MKLRGNFKLSEVKKIRIKKDSIEESNLNIEEDSIVEFNFKEEGKLLEININKIEIK